jgi:predicted Ser/Thr protein kinase
MRVDEATAANGVLDRIKMVTGDLETLSADIHREINELRLFADISTGKRATATSLTEFKATLDQLRKVLWSYLEQTDPGEAISTSKMQALRGSSGILASRYPLVDEPPATAPVSFFDRLDVVIDAYMKKSEGSIPPVARKRGKR